VLDLISHTIRRELGALRRELLAYADERDLWRTPPGISNSAGNLTLHVVGNLRHFVGAQLGNTGYRRNRAAEFSSRDIPRDDLLEEIESAAANVKSTLTRLSPADLDAPYPLEVMGARLQTSDFLLHLVAHLAYHLGQVDYHRRIVTGDPEGVEALAVPELLTATVAAEPEA
jgi:hypothetical protein